MRRRAGASTCFLILLALALVVIIRSEAVSSEVFYDDQSLSGIHEDKVMDIWGNVTVPDDATLTLRNVTLTFRSGGGYTPCLWIGVNASLVITDGDGDPGTTTDASLVRSLGTRWQLQAHDAHSLTIESSSVAGLCEDYGAPNPVISSVGVAHGSFSNASIYDLRGLLYIRGTVGIDMFDTRVSGQYHAFEVSSPLLRIRRSEFEGGNYSLKANSETGIDIRSSTFSSRDGIGLYSNSCGLVDNCSFSGSNLGLYTSDVPLLGLTIVRCHFEDCHRGTEDYGSRDIALTDCRFENGRSGVTLARSVQYRLSNVSFVDIVTAIEATSHESLELVNCTMVSCEKGVVSTNAQADERFLGCWFGDIEDTAIELRTQDERVGYEWVDNCTFDNASTGVSCSYFDQPSSGYSAMLSVYRSTFMGVEVGISTQWNRLYMMDNLFSGGRGTQNVGIGVQFNTTTRMMEGYGVVIGSTFRELDIGIHVDTVFLMGPSWYMWQDTFEACEVGAHVWNSTRFRCNDSRILECRVGLEVLSSENFLVDNISVADSGTGIYIDRCDEFEIGHLQDLGGNSILIREVRIDNAHWHVERDSTFVGCSLILGGELNISAAFELRNATLSMVAESSDSPHVEVQTGGVLVLESSTLFGSSTNPYSLLVHEGGALLASNSTIRRCGSALGGPLGLGPTVVKGSIDVFRTEFRECFRGLVLIESEAALHECELYGTDVGLSIERSIVCLTQSRIDSINMGVVAIVSNLTFERSVIDASMASISATRCHVTAIDTIFLGIAIGVALFNSSAVMNGINVMVSGIMIDANGSSVELWGCNISSVSTHARVRAGSVVRLYNSTWKGIWSVTGVESRLEVYWSHRVAVLYNWSKQPAEGVGVVVASVTNPSERMHIGIDDSGGSGTFWLLERRKEQDSSEVLAPYSIIYEAEGLYGEVTTPCKEPWSSLLLVDDVSPPSVTIVAPSSGGLYGKAMVVASGSHEDLGSGHSALLLRLNNGVWIQLEPIGDKWAIDLLCPDGRNELQVEAKDKAGHATGVTTWFLVDTHPPSLTLSGPRNNTIVGTEMIQVTGNASDSGPAGIREVLVNRVRVTQDGTGAFSQAVDLASEGANIIFVEAIDHANNSVHVALVIRRDTTPPLLRLDPLPSVTNDRQLIVSGYCEDASGANLTVAHEGLGLVSGLRFNVVVNLTEGDNRIRVMATDLMGLSTLIEANVTLDTVIDCTVLSPAEGLELNASPVIIVIGLESNAEIRIPGWTEWTPPGENGTVVFVLDLEVGRDDFLILELRDMLGNRDVRDLNLLWEEVEESPPSNEDSDIVLAVAAASLVLATLIAGAYLFTLRRRRVE